jgi:prepilin-type N-terminal cleavage/methylation domain-containing protein
VFGVAGMSLFEKPYWGKIFTNFFEEGVPLMKRCTQHTQRHISLRQQGVTLMELLVVVAIISIIALTSLPNIPPILAGNRIRSTSNNLLSKMRSIRSVAIAKRRQLDVVLDTDNYVLKVQKPAHTEYDLLKDIAEAISTSSATYPNLSSFILYEEDSQTLEEVKLGTDTHRSGIDKMETDCPSKKISFNPSGTIQDTCTIWLKNKRSTTQYELRLYKGGQVVMERLNYDGT